MFKNKKLFLLNKIVLACVYFYFFVKFKREKIEKVTFIFFVEKEVIEIEIFKFYI